MTDQELDRLMQRVLLDAVKLDCERETGNAPSFVPTPRYQRQMTAMLADPLKWARKRARPVWKRVIQKAAVILLVFSLSLGSLIAVSPTVRAAVVRWVTEWFDTHITYRYSGETLIGEMPQYEITDLPKGYVEDENQRIEGPNYVGIVYRSETDADADPIYFDYMYMQQGSASDYAVEDTTILQVTVNGMEGYLYLTTIPEQSDSTITWIDSANNIQFSVDAALDEVGILHIAESVSLVNWR